MASKRFLALLGLGAGLAAREYAYRRGAIDLRNNVVLITGGSRGLGLAMAQEFAREGASIAICARDLDELERARGEIERAGGEVMTVQCDVTDPDQVETMVARVTSHFGRIDVLVNNAGVIMVGPVENQTLEDFRQCMDVMYWGTVYTTLAALPQMRARGFGRIVNITSIGGKLPVPHLISYNAAKHAAVGFSETLRTEVAKDGVAVVTVVPGLMRTGSQVNAYFKGQNQAEYGLFSPLASLPISSIDAHRAARQIVGATRRGDPELIVSIQAQVAARLHGLFPGMVTELMALGGRVLPGPGGIGAERARGRESENAVSQSFLTALGRRAAEELNQNELKVEG
jgi:NAD(P)-dependent dehydrogenase (short-subunit alcohol dehydrogenase family)